MPDSRRIVIAGASGFLGKRLTYALRMKGYEVTLLQRKMADDSAQDAASSSPHPAVEGEAPVSPTWDPAVGELDEAHLAGSFAVICLSGASIAGRPWTTEYMHTLRESRLTAVDTLVAAMGRLEAEQRPGAFLCASAVGYYGHKADAHPITEDAPQGRGFLADLCADWEAHANRAGNLGVRTVNLRTGLVMGADGGMLKILLTPYRWGMGARFGSGAAWMPLISAHDWVSAVLFFLEHPALDGPFNLCAPRPVQSADFQALLGRRVGSPAFLAVPSAVRYLGPAPLRTFTEEVLLSSQRTVPQRLVDAGFSFTAPHARKILQQVLPRH